MELAAHKIAWVRYAKSGSQKDILGIRLNNEQKHRIRERKCLKSTDIENS